MCPRSHRGRRRPLQVEPNRTEREKQRSAESAGGGQVPRVLRTRCRAGKARNQTTPNQEQITRVNFRIGDANAGIDYLILYHFHFYCFRRSRSIAFFFHFEYCFRRYACRQFAPEQPQPHGYDRATGHRLQPGAQLHQRSVQLQRRPQRQQQR
uniref:(northern house mosquito) hypothetical protein n=1 Tax=Culex pipiens TaxID=7175 RepID=A0A8D8D870_CULPI